MRASHHYSRPCAMKATVLMQTWRLNNDATAAARVTVRTHCPGAVHRVAAYGGRQRARQHPRTQSSVTRIRPAEGAGSHGSGGDTDGFAVAVRTCEEAQRPFKTAADTQARRPAARYRRDRNIRNGSAAHRTPGPRSPGTSVELVRPGYAAFRRAAA